MIIKTGHFLKTNYRLYLLLPLLLMGTAAIAQVNISGRVLDDKEKPVRGASVYLDNTLDGASTDSLGNFKFTTTEKGDQTIVASEVTHQNGGMPLNVDKDQKDIIIHLKGNKVRDLDQVVITAGSIEASNDNKTVLKPLDIVTTAGTQADVVRAIQTLPGTQQQGTETGLFVRGGDASEAAIVIDEMVVQNAFFGGPPGVATRSRFGPFQFKGVSFSSGGYSARYGQALSSVLELNSNDLPDKSNVNLGVNMAGVYASGTHLWKNASIDGSGSYNNLTPFYKLAKTNVNYYQVPQSGSAGTRFVWKPNKNGILKVSVNGSYTEAGVGVPNPFYSADTTQPKELNFSLKEQNYYSNASYRQMFKDKFSLYTAASYSYNNSDNKFGPIAVPQSDKRLQYRLEGKYYATSRLGILLGGEFQNFTVKRQYDTLRSSFTENAIVGYTEIDWAPFTWLAIRPGARFEHSELLQKNNIAPRISMAIKTGTYSQVSLAGGMFYQNPDNVYLYGVPPATTLNYQRAIHYIANWQWAKNDRTLRIEGYYKDYSDLIKAHTAYNPNTYNTYYGTFIDNAGKGYARGLELFWRDRKSIKNLDYWVSYSFIDTKRNYANFVDSSKGQTMFTPTFISNHNLNIIAKYFIDKIQTNISATYSFATGKPYYNPDPSVEFLSQRTPAYHNLSVTLSYLTHVKKWFTVVYAGLDNITNSKNVFGYRYDQAGNRSEVKPALYRSIFVGVNFSLTEFKKDEL